MNSVSSHRFDEYDVRRDSPGNCHRGRKAVKLRLETLVPGEMAYLLGLFLADGCRRTRINKRNSREFFVKFTFQENEGEIAERTVHILEKVGLNPFIERPRQSRTLIVKVWSRALFEFLPDKVLLLRDSGYRNQFFEENSLEAVKCGVPFLGGLLDGDGSCRMRLKRNKYGRVLVDKWTWYFVQSSYLFLVDYVSKFVRTLAKTERGVWIRHYGDKRGSHVRFLKCGSIALLEAGIAGHSWKVAKWLEEHRLMQRERKV